MERKCPQCSASLLGKRSNAIYCSRTCKTRASDARRVEDGRSRERDQERYWGSEKRREDVKAAARRQDRQVETSVLNEASRQRYARSEARREYCREYAKRYLAENLERMRAIRRRRKGELRARAYLFTERDWSRLVARYRGCCAYCGRRSPLQREHVIPLSRGGTHSVGNILPACASCNYSKHTRTIMEWRLRQIRSVRR